MEVFSGRDFLSYFRKYEDRATESASKLRFITEKSISKSKDNETTMTVDGPINAISDGENTADFTSLAHTTDGDTIAMWEQLEEWFDEGALVEYWNVNARSLADDTVRAEYARGYFTSFDISYPADGQVEVSYSYAINGTPVKGEDTLTPEQIEDLQSAQYEYTQMQELGESV